MSFKMLGCSSVWEKSVCPACSIAVRLVELQADASSTGQGQAAAELGDTPVSG